MTTTETKAELRKKRNEYKRQWYQENKHRHAMYQIKYWTKILKQYENETEQN